MSFPVLRSARNKNRAERQGFCCRRLNKTARKHPEKPKLKEGKNMKDLELCKLKLRYATLRARHYARQQMQEIKGCIKEKPGIYLSIAVGIGILAGRLLSKNR